MSLIAITPERFDVDLSLAYATEDNFTGKPIYKKAAAFLHHDAAAKLKTAIKLAAQQNLHFKIFDAYRPLEGQWALWNHTPDPNYISHPETGSIPHCRGVAVDLTLIDNEGKALEMGTDFDDFSERAHHGNLDISQDAIRNRFILMGIMTTAGWDFYRNEWWHYQLFSPRHYDALTDIDAKTNMI